MDHFLGYEICQNILAVRFGTLAFRVQGCMHIVTDPSMYIGVSGNKRIEKVCPGFS